MESQGEYLGEYLFNVALDLALGGYASKSDELIEFGEDTSKTVTKQIMLDETKDAVSKAKGNYLLDDIDDLPVVSLYENSHKNFKVVQEFTAEDVNQWFIDNIDPKYRPPYKPGTRVKEIELAQNTTFVRVYDNLPKGSGMYGGWVMKAEDIAGLTPAEIKNKFALPNKPIYVCEVEIEAGTHIRVGEVNPLDGWGTGGGIQYDLIGQKTGTFTNEKLLEFLENE